jgi:hypothetical protein
MANTSNAKMNAVRLDRGRPRNFSTATRPSGGRWITRGILPGFVGILMANAPSTLCATFYRATAARSANTAMSTLGHAHHDEGRGRSADAGGRDVTAPADLRSETTAIASPAAGGPAGDRPLAGPMVSLTPEPIIETQELLGANTPDLWADELVNKVLVQREAVAATAGRADDFSWPRPDSVSSRYPEITTTEVPKRPMSSKDSKAGPRPSNDEVSLMRANSFWPRPVNQRSAQRNYNDIAHDRGALDSGSTNHQIAFHKDFRRHAQ